MTDLDYIHKAIIESKGCEEDSFPYEYIQLPDMTLDYNPAESVTKNIGHIDVPEEDINIKHYICEVVEPGSVFSRVGQVTNLKFDNIDATSIFYSSSANTTLRIFIINEDKDDYKKGDLVLQYVFGSAEAQLEVQQITKYIILL